jgi:hypothetical protein
METRACMKLPLLGMGTGTRRACRILSTGIVEYSLTSRFPPVSFSSTK